MKMKIIKKNQLAISVIALMLITAGYLSYDTNTQNGQGIEASTGLNETLDLASLGDAELVNTEVTEENKEEVEEEPKQEEKAPEQNKTTKVAGTDNYFETSKLERNVMYSQMTERYQQIITSNSQSEEQKAVAGEEINKINNMQNAIMIAENLLSSKGFNKNIIFVNGDSVSVIIGKENLAPEEIAQIQNIVSRELKAEIDNIHISVK